MTPQMMSRKMTAEAQGYRVQSNREGDDTPHYHLFKPGGLFHGSYSTEERAWREASRLMLLNEIRKLDKKIEELDTEK